MLLMMTDEPETAESNKIPVDESDLRAIDADFELIKAKVVIRKLVIACEKALTLRGLWTAINDPLALEGEKQELREKFKKIELEIRAAIVEGDKIKAEGLTRKIKVSEDGLVVGDKTYWDNELAEYVDEEVEVLVGRSADFIRVFLPNGRVLQVVELF